MSDAFDRLVAVMDKLRDPNGCPWDREQTTDTLRKFLLEETYELLEELEEGSPEKIKEELGDLLFQIIFLSRIFKERSAFTIDDVIESITDKMIRRHQHIFGDKSAVNSDQVLEIWDEEKRKENDNNDSHSLLDGVPKHQPALLRAHQISSRVAKAGFEWNRIESVIDKMREELDEIEQAVSRNNKDKIEEEIGDLLFTLVNISRFIDINSEFALQGACNKFDRRWRYIERKLKETGKSPRESSLDEMEALWQESKIAER